MPFNHMRAVRFELVFQLSVALCSLIVLAIGLTELLGRERMIRWASHFWTALTGA
ncbi:MAG: hypothetical protein AAF317_00580 [Pseudomonadota bacterium]